MVLNGTGNKVLAITLVMAFLALFSSCGDKTTKTNKANPLDTTELPAFINFNGDSAYRYVADQVEFGPRTMNSDAHQKCGDYMVAQLNRFGAKVYEQKTVVNGFDGVELKMRNIIGAYNEASQERILLCAHWDTRPWADQEEDKTLQHKPIDGANDGGSGVGVLLEVARQLQQRAPSVGIDIVFFDAEDRGAPGWVEERSSESWCLGSQYWSKNPHVSGYSAKYGILLDMVGAPNAIFVMEPYSLYYAKGVVENVWSKAHELGYGSFFRYEKGSGVLDDHYFVNKIANIPCIDIIQYEPTSKSGFGHYWHTHNDTMDGIDKNTLKAVGKTVLKVVYDEK